MEEKRLKKKKTKALEDGNRTLLAVACNDLGDFYNQQGRFEQAVIEYQEEAEIYKMLCNRLEMAKAHRMIAEMYMLLSEFDNALKHVNIYLKTVKDLGNKLEEQRAYATIGRSHLLHGQSLNELSDAMRPLKNAEKAFIQSLLICKELSGSISKIEILDMQARLYLNIGVVKEHMEKFEESIKYMEKAITISKINDLFELLHLCYMSVSLLYHYKKNDTTAALRFCNLALEVAERLPNKSKKQCETLITKSEIMIKIGDFPSAKQVLQKAYKLKSPDLNDQKIIEKSLKIVAALCYTLDSLIVSDSTDYDNKKKLYEKMGDGCCMLHNYSKAIDYYLKMLECAELTSSTSKDLATIYVSLYQTYKDNKQYDLALEYLWKEFEINKNEPLEAFNTLCNIGEVCELLMKPFWTIQDVYSKALAEAKKIKRIKLEKIALVRLYRLQQKFNMNTLADELKENANKDGIELDELDDDSDTETNTVNSDQNTPNIGDDICLEDLTDSDSESEDTERPRSARKRGTCLTIKRNNKGETQLHQACISGNLTLVRRLIDQGHTVNVRDHAGWLPLHEACNHGHRDIVELLLNKGAFSTINDKGGTSCDGITPLYDACSNGFLDVVELLLERGANATLRTDFGDIPLNALDKWRNSVDLDVFEQAQYENIRSKLVEQLSKTGVSESSNPITENSNVSPTKHLRKFINASHSDTSSRDEITNPINRSRSNNICIDESTTSFNMVTDQNVNSKVNPRQIYKDVMENVKHPNRIHNIISNDSKNKRRSAFLQPEEVDDDWLENDIIQDKKKRKYLTDRLIFDQNEKSGRISETNNSDHSTKENVINDFNFSDDSQDAFQILLESRKSTNSMSKKRSSCRSNSSSSNRQMRSKQQSSLLDSGFSRFSSPSLSGEDSNEPKTTEPDSTTSHTVLNSNANVTPKHNNSENSQTKVASPIATVSFKIKVENELLLVPVDSKKINEANIRWLAEEASRRYYNLIGLRPILRLMTADGFAFEETDLISVALNETMISSKVLEWKISPLAQRYVEICSQLNLDLDSSIKIELERSETTNNLTLCDYFLTSFMSQPILKALFHQSTLTILNISNNFIQDEGCKYLGKSLTTLGQLKTLNLKGNCITANGINYLYTSLINNSTELFLEELCLSFNPIGNKSLSILEKLCKKFPKLKKLYLSSCHITYLYNFDLFYYELIEFDISFNFLSIESIKFLLTKLNSCRLEYINLNFSSIDFIGFGSKFIEFLENGTCEHFKHIELAGCQLTDSDIYSITQNLSKANELIQFNLSHNSKITILSLQYILQNISHTRKLFLQQCKNIFYNQLNTIHFNIDNNKFPEYITLSSNDENITEEKDILQKFWTSQFNERAKILIQNNSITLYINDSDLL